MKKMTKEEVIYELGNMRMDFCIVLDNKLKKDFFTEQARIRFVALAFAIRSIQREAKLERACGTALLMLLKLGQKNSRGFVEISQALKKDDEE